MSILSVKAELKHISLWHQKNPRSAFVLFSYPFSSLIHSSLSSTTVTNWCFVSIATQSIVLLKVSLTEHSGKTLSLFVHCQMLHLEMVSERCLPKTVDVCRLHTCMSTTAVASCSAHEFWVILSFTVNVLLLYCIHGRGPHISHSISLINFLTFFFTIFMAHLSLQGNLSRAGGDKRGSKHLC